MKKTKTARFLFLKRSFVIQSISNFKPIVYVRKIVNFLSMSIHTIFYLKLFHFTITFQLQNAGFGFFFFETKNRETCKKQTKFFI